MYQRILSRIRAMLPARNRALSASGSATSPGAVGPSSVEVGQVEIVTTLERLDKKLAEVDAASRISDDAMRAVFATFRMEIPLESRDEPWSDNWRFAFQGGVMVSRSDQLGLLA